jgi:hypothetical protein
MSGEKKRCDLAEIKKAIGVLYEPGQIVEVRMTDKKKKLTAAGWFDDMEIMGKAVARVARDGFGDPNGYKFIHENVFWTCNPVHDALLARQPKNTIPFVDAATSDLHAIAITPAGPMELVRSSISIVSGLPCEKVRSAPAIIVSGQVFVMLASGGEPLQLTKDEGDKIVRGFSFDGTEIYFSQTLGEDEIWSIPTLGGSAKHLASGRFVASSPDGQYLYVEKGDSQIVRMAKASDSEEAIYALPSFGGLRVYPDGQHLLVCTLHSGVLTLGRLDIVARKLEKLADVPNAGSYASWAMPGESVYLSRMPQPRNVRTNELE